MIKYFVNQKNCCIDVEGALARLGNNEQLYYRILHKYLEDGSCNNYIKAIENEDYDNAERHIHSLKGVAANLGFICLENISGRILNALRVKEYQNIDMYTEKLEREEKRIIDIIQSFQSKSEK